MTRRTQDRKSPPLIDRFLSQSLGDGGLDPQSALKLRDVAWLAGLAAGGDDMLGDIDKESVQISTEMILARQPDVILELNAANQLNDADLKKIVDPWMTLSSVPAVKNRRVVVLLGAAMSVPGPRVAHSIEKMARALHP